MRALGTILWLAGLAAIASAAAFAPASAPGPRSAAAAAQVVFASYRVHGPGALPINNVSTDFFVHGLQLGLKRVPDTVAALTSTQEGTALERPGFEPQPTVLNVVQLTTHGPPQKLAALYVQLAGQSLDDLNGMLKPTGQVAELISLNSTRPLSPAPGPSSRGIPMLQVRAAAPSPDGPSPLRAPYIPKAGQTGPAELKSLSISYHAPSGQPSGAPVGSSPRVPSIAPAGGSFSKTALSPAYAALQQLNGTIVIQYELRLTGTAFYPFTQDVKEAVTSAFTQAASAAVGPVVAQVVAYKEIPGGLAPRAAPSPHTRRSLLAPPTGGSLSPSYPGVDVVLSVSQASEDTSQAAKDKLSKALHQEGFLRELAAGISNRGFPLMYRANTTPTAPPGLAPKSSPTKQATPIFIDAPAPAPLAAALGAVPIVAPAPGPLAPASGGLPPANSAPAPAPASLTQVPNVALMGLPGMSASAPGPQAQGPNVAPTGLPASSAPAPGPFALGSTQGALVAPAPAPEGQGSALPPSRPPAMAPQMDAPAPAPKKAAPVAALGGNGLLTGNAHERSYRPTGPSLSPAESPQQTAPSPMGAMNTPASVPLLGTGSLGPPVPSPPRASAPAPGESPESKFKHDVLSALAGILVGGFLLMMCLCVNCWAVGRSRRLNSMTPSQREAQGLAAAEAKKAKASPKSLEKSSNGYIGAYPGGSVGAMSKLSSMPDLGSMTCEEAVRLLAKKLGPGLRGGEVPTYIVRGPGDSGHRNALPAGSALVGRYAIQGQQRERSDGCFFSTAQDLRAPTNTVSIKAFADQAAYERELAFFIVATTPFAEESHVPHLLQAISAKTLEGEELKAAQREGARRGLVATRVMSALVMERGHMTLGDWMRGLGPRSAAGDDVRYTFFGICLTVHALHGQQLVHGNLSPEAFVWHGASGRWKLAECGRWGHSGQAFAPTYTPLLRYTAPEVIEAMVKGDQQSAPMADTSQDVYALGCIAFEMFTGSPLFPRPGARRQPLGGRSGAMPPLSHHSSLTGQGMDSGPLGNPYGPSSGSLYESQNPNSGPLSSPDPSGPLRTSLSSHPLRQSMGSLQKRPSQDPISPRGVIFPGEEQRGDSTSPRGVLLVAEDPPEPISESEPSGDRAAVRARLAKIRNWRLGGRKTPQGLAEDSKAGAKGDLQLPGMTAEAVAACQLGFRPVPYANTPATWNPIEDGQIKALILAMLHKSPAQRPPVNTIIHSNPLRDLLNTSDKGEGSPDSPSTPSRGEREPRPQ